MGELRNREKSYDGEETPAMTTMTLHVETDTW